MTDPFETYRLADLKRAQVLNMQRLQDLGSNSIRPDTTRPHYLETSALRSHLEQKANAGTATTLDVKTLAALDKFDILQSKNGSITFDGKDVSVPVRKLHRAVFTTMLKTDSFEDIYDVELLDNVEQSAKIKKIGHTLNKIGGFSLMQSAGEAIAPSVSREVETLWNGIGDWKS